MCGSYSMWLHDHSGNEGRHPVAIHDHCGNEGWRPIATAYGYMITVVMKADIL